MRAEGCRRMDLFATLRMTLFGGSRGREDQRPLQSENRLNADQENRVKHQTI